MKFLNSTTMPVADHFMARKRRGQTEPLLGAACERCFAYCANDTELWKHVRREHGADASLSCPKRGCGKRFVARALRAAHLAHHWRVRDRRPYTCEMCGLLTAGREPFDKHVARKHPQARAVICGVCRLMTRDVPTLVGHVRRRHAAETLRKKQRSKRCNVCGKPYGNFTALEKHVRIHAAEYEPATGPRD